MSYMFIAAAAVGGAAATAVVALAVVCLLSASARTRSRICNDYYAIMKNIAVFRIQIC